MRPVALVTGGTRRVGAAIALELARAGFDLVITYRHDRANALVVLEAAVAAGAACRATHLDMAALPAPGELRAAMGLDRLDALVLNASMWERQPLSELTEEALLANLRVNAVAPLRLVQGLRGLLEGSSLAGGGSVVAIGDAHAHGTPVTGYGGYLMSKAALAQAVQQVAVELAPRVRANAVLPGVVAWPERMSAAERERLLERVPLGRAGQPEDVARLVRFLCMEAPFVTGALIPVDGGRSLR